MHNSKIYALIFAQDAQHSFFTSLQLQGSLAIKSWQVIPGPFDCIFPISLSTHAPASDNKTQLIDHKWNQTMESDYIEHSLLFCCDNKSTFI